MRILIDLQGAQSESRFRGIGRYSLALALGIARNAGEHEIWLILNGALAPAIADLRRAFAGLVPQERIRVFDVITPAAEIDAANTTRCRASELLREHFIEQLNPDAVLVTSLFEGYIDDAVVSAGSLADGARTAVVLYDLIPFLNPDAYLGTPEQRQHYAGKIASLKRAGLLLAISDYTRQEAIDALALDPGQVAAISTAVDASFHPAEPGPGLPALQRRLGIERATIMYAPGGFDTRKNIDGLITAFSMLPPSIRARHQLVIASKLGEHERNVMGEHAKAQGLAPGELILTGYVSDADLIALYRSTALFVFPSKHEGFGLPALEAMACGALVIGADNTSIPEVIGCDEALFDAASPAAIATKIAQVLADPAMQARLRSHGQAQAARFSWDVSAHKALRALETHLPQHRWRAPDAKPRLAFVSPLAGGDSAAHAARVLPALLVHFDIELVHDTPDAVVPDALAALPLRSPQWLDRHATAFDQILYQIGNSPAHAYVFALLQDHPGVVVLHDFFLGDALALAHARGALPGAWPDALYYAHGYPGLRSASGAAAGATQAYPCNRAPLERATAVIVHAQQVRDLANQWIGADAVANWHLVPPHSPADCAAHYAAVLTQAQRAARGGRSALLRSLTALPGVAGDESTLRGAAHCLAGMPDPLRPRQLLVDVSADSDAHGAPMVRDQLLALLQAPHARLRVEPVRLSNEGGQWHYRYAQRYTHRLLGIEGASAPDAAIDIGPGDLFYGLGCVAAALTQAAAAGVYAHLRQRGAGVSFLVCEPPPASDAMAPGADQAHAAWLAAIAAEAHTLWCATPAAKVALDQWIARQGGLAPTQATALLPQGGAEQDAPALLAMLSAAQQAR